MAVATAAVIGAGAAVGGAVQARKAGKAAQAAGDRQAEAQDQAALESSRQFDLTRQDMLTAQQFSQDQQQPFQEAGVQALGQQQALLGLSGKDAQQQAFAGLSESPGQQFLRKRAERSLLRNASAIGGLGGGNVRTALQEQAVGLAQQDIQNQFGRLGQIAGQGRAAGASIGAGAVGTAGSIGQFGANNVANVNASNQAAAEARASGVLGAQQARGQGIAQLFQGAGQFASAFNRPQQVRPTYINGAAQAGPFQQSGQF